MYQYQNQTFTSNNISCVIEDEKILQVDYLSGSKTQIGITNAEHEKQTEVLETYYNKLVELGVIEKEKTPEELQKENQELINKLLHKIDDLEKKVSDNSESKRPNKTNGKNGELSRQ